MAKWDAPTVVSVGFVRPACMQLTTTDRVPLQLHYKKQLCSVPMTDEDRQNTSRHVSTAQWTSLPGPHVISTPIRKGKEKVDTIHNATSSGNAEQERLSSMEKNKSFPAYSYSSASCSGEFEFQDHRSNSYSFNGPKNDNPELKRKRRIAAYNVFTMEGKLKSSVRNSVKWIKSKFTGDLPYDV
ncbi:hypothetical protein CRG98_021544 [Punica granatum]|uniref:Uncharacterized protein n=1 Tax=Punica granatum TaxID=22663 RepID=A0A2I0JP75_PUNGR|nr:hypothetical protein CRG98_021544 [Punica granatum]